jgi:hypothetical protein
VPDASLSFDGGAALAATLRSLVDQVVDQV